ncbi:MAG: protein phosphatase 2C domain-containing protein, partial [Verrucomicrobiota bacterium]
MAARFWTVAKHDHIGDRNEQQDRVEVLPGAHPETELLIVADGVGGHRGGALASEAVVETARHLWAHCQGNPPDPEQFLYELCDRAHKRIDQVDTEGDRQPRATIVALLLTPGWAYWIHAGDSRLYAFGNDPKPYRTKDHSVVQILVDQGKVREDEMGTHPDQGRLLQSLGGGGDLSLHVETKPRTKFFGFLLCTDGFWERISEAEMRQLLSKPDQLSRYLPRIVQDAVNRSNGKSDNVSVAIAVHQPGNAAAPPLPSQSAQNAPPPRRKKKGLAGLILAIVMIGFVCAALMLFVFFQLKPPKLQEETGAVAGVSDSSGSTEQREPDPQEQHSDEEDEAQGQPDSDPSKQEDNPDPDAEEQSDPEIDDLGAKPSITPESDGPPNSRKGNNGDQGDAPGNDSRIGALDEALSDLEWITIDAAGEEFRISRFEVTNRLYYSVVDSDSDSRDENEERLPVT